MASVLLASRRNAPSASSELIHAASIVREAAEALAEETQESSKTARYLLVADRLTTALESPRGDLQRLLMTSPALTGRSGRSQTLIEMIEAEPGDDAHRLRLAKILFRALVWIPETFPNPSD